MDLNEKQLQMWKRQREKQFKQDYIEYLKREILIFAIDEEGRYATTREIAKLFGVSHSFVARALRDGGMTWKRFETLKFTYYTWWFEGDRNSLRRLPEPVLPDDLHVDPKLAKMREDCDKANKAVERANKGLAKVERVIELSEHIKALEDMPLKEILRFDRTNKESRDLQRSVRQEEEVWESERRFKSGTNKLMVAIATSKLKEQEDKAKIP